MIFPYGRQNISSDDIQSVVDVLKSDFLTQGPAVPAFEQALCNYTGATHGVAVSSGTAALHVACLALGLREGDWLWTSAVSFVASANCGLYCGARVDFVDIDPRSWNLSADRLKEKLIEAERNGSLPKVLVVVHLSGLPCDMRSIQALSREYGFHIIEDACHAIGGSYLDEPVGNCRYSDITVFSFHPVKTITTGEGGMAMTNDARLAEQMRLLRGHGITRDPQRMTREPDGPWYYQQVDLGFNYRLTDIQAALGIAQLRRLDEFEGKRHEIARQYDELLSDLPLCLPHRCEHAVSGMHLYVVRIKSNELKASHRQIYEDLWERGVRVNLHYIPIHTQPYFQKMGFSEGDFPAAEAYYQEAMSLPMYVDLAVDDIRYICNTLAAVLV